MASTPKGLSDEKAARMMAALREGGTLRVFGVRAPRLETYFKIHPEYAEEARPLIEANAKAALGRKGSHIRNRTHCINGHSFAEFGRVAMHKGWMTRQCRTCETMRSRRGDKIKPDVLVEVKSALKRGLTIGAITASGRPTRLVKHNALARYRHENPEFDRFVSDLTKDNNSRGQRLRWLRIKNEERREQNNDYYKIREMIPEGNPHRGDIVARIFEDILGGSLDRKDVPSRIKLYVAEFNRLYPTNYAKFGSSPLVSLDEVLFDDGARTRGDTITRGLWD